MKETFESVKGLSNYKIGDKGTIISLFKGNKMNPFKSKTSNYLMIKLITDDGTRKTFLVHRLVAQAFIDNPNNLPEVNHLDRNPSNCEASNLEWCTRKQNLEYSNVLDNPVKNKVGCKLYKGNTLIKTFKSVKEACVYASKMYNVSMQSLYRYHKIKGSDIFITTEIHDSTKYIGRKTNRSSRKIPTDIYIDGVYIKRLPSIKEAKEYVEKECGVPKGVLMIKNQWKNVEIRPSKHTKRKIYSNTANIRNKV